MAKNTDLQQFMKKFDKISQEKFFVEDQLLKSTEPEDHSLRPTNSEIFSIIFKPISNFLKFLALITVYNAISLNYIGVTVGITNLLQINPYYTFSLSALFEFVGTILCFINNRLGRKKALFIYLLITSVSTLMVAFVPYSDYFSWFLILKIIFFLIARTMISAAFNTIIVYSAELYEVRARNTAVVILGSFGYFASLISPQINQLKTVVWQPLPYFIYAMSGFVSCLILRFMPETYHKT